jgi:hypothetical protein
VRRVSFETDCRIVRLVLSINKVLIFPLNPFDFNRERYSSALPVLATSLIRQFLGDLNRNIYQPLPTPKPFPFTGIL